MNKTAKRLRAMREWLGLTQKELAIKCGVTSGNVNSVEKDFNSVGLPKIEAFIERYLPDFSNHVFNLTVQQIALRNKALERTFETGKNYIIRETSCSNSEKNFGRSRGTEKTFFGGTWSDDCVFEYIGKQGIHHCFKEIYGGWLRTYTDPQLIGKKIEEVNV